MKEERMTLTTWIGKYVGGEFQDTDVRTQCKAGWYDWFCKDSSLSAKTEKLGRKVLQIARSTKFNNDKVYVFFKNNCPLEGTLYDDFRICDIDTGDVIYTITPANGHKSDKGKANVWGRENTFEEPLVEGTWDDVKKFFGVK